MGKGDSDHERLRTGEYIGNVLAPMLSPDPEFASDSDEEAVHYQSLT